MQNNLNAKVSVVMPVYNGEKYLKEAIDSILNQKFIDFEFIIIDDGSSDKSVEIIKSYSDPRIILLEEEHRGLVDTLNKGCNHSKTDYIVRMDADDISRPDRIEKLYDFMQKNPDIAICGSWAELINVDGDVVGTKDYVKSSSKQIRIQSIFTTPFVHPSVIFLKDVFNKVGGYKHFNYVEDYELWSRIVPFYQTSNLAEPLLKYRIHETQITSRLKNYVRLKSMYIRILFFFRLAVWFFSNKFLVKSNFKINKKETKKWIDLNGDKTYRLEYDLNEKSIVFDVGGYKGSWSYEIYSKYNPYIYIYEPLNIHYLKIKEKFKNNPKVKIFKCGLSGNTSESKIFLSGDATSVYLKDNEEHELVSLLDFEDCIKKNSISHIDLIKINIEGGEYDLLEKIISIDFHKNIKDIQVQFHNYGKEAELRRKKIRDELSRTHYQTYNFDFVWENWRLKNKNETKN